TPGPSVAVFGYRTVHTAKYVLLYNSWTKTPEEWLYNHYTWTGHVANRIELHRYIPAGKELKSELFVATPSGGGSYVAGAHNLIEFYAGDDIRLARIEYSADGGKTWSFVVTMKVEAGWNKFNWLWPETPTYFARIRVKGLSAEGDYLAGDGSFQNVSLQ
ncbi:MAG: hypothetical protein JRH20_12710, partial [Deltaproteobacteria bacterium]|nr:hypothetical protein [Deltaproteobacteria bacterium]